MKIQTTLPFLMAGLLLAGCGGGGATTTTSIANTVMVDTGSSYTGSRNTALLTLLNNTEFVQLVLGTESLNNHFAARSAPPTSATVASSQEATPFQAERLLIEMTAEHFNSTRYQARAVNEVRNCLNGGTTTLSGNLNEQTLTGTLQITYNQCGDGNTSLNGTAVFVIHSFSTSQDQPIAFTISMNALEARINQTAYRMTGTIRADLNTITGQTILTENLFRQDINTAKQALVENVKIVEEVNGSIAISGKFCEGRHGCVTATTADNLLYSMRGDLLTGRLFLKGAAGSLLQISALEGSARDGGYSLFQVMLDGNGDGVYDAYFTSNGTTFTSIPNPNVTSNTAPVANPDFTERDMALGGVLQLDASNSRDYESPDLLFQWTVESAPEGSTAKISANALPKPTFKPDKEGSYRISLKVTDPQGLSSLATVSLNVRGAVRQFSYNVVDAEYSDALERLIVVSSQPSHALQIIDPATGVQKSVPLALAAHNVAVSPDGKTAVVGHDGAVTLVDLQNIRISKFFDNIGFNVFDIVLGNNGMAYASRIGLQWDSLYSINLVTGDVLRNTGSSIYGGVRLQVIPRLNAVYSILAGLSPGDLERFNTSTTPLSYLYDSPYYGDYAIGDNLWVTEDGLSILTAAGTMFQTAALQDQDMRYQRKLPEAGQSDMRFNVFHADHSQEVNKFVVASVEHSAYASGVLGAINLKVYTTPLLNLESSTSLNNVTFDGGGQAVIPQFVFFNSNGIKRYAVLQQGNGTYLMGF